MRLTPRLRRISPARRCAFVVLLRTFEKLGFTDVALAAEADHLRLAPRDRALARTLAYGAVQRRRTLDALLEELSRRPVERLDPGTRAAARLGLYQLAYLDGIGHHAAVNESVELARAWGSHGHGLVNAVLRRATTAARPWVDGLTDDAPQAAALKHSHPDWVAELWWSVFGGDEARALMAANNRPSEYALRANELVTTPAELSRQLAAAGVRAEPAEEVPEGVVLHSPFDASGSELWRAGAIMPQSRASMLVARIVDPKPGERVLDLCAAPGGKTSHLAALMGGQGRVVAVEKQRGRGRALRANCDRLRATNVSVRIGDARDSHGDGYDRVLVDPTCTGLGTLSGRPDMRWRTSPKLLSELVVQQREILDAAHRSLRPGGVLVFSTCTLSPQENEDQVTRALAVHHDLELEDIGRDHPTWKHPDMPEALLTLPHRHRTDGFFIARLRRRGGTG